MKRTLWGGLNRNLSNKQLLRTPIRQLPGPRGSRGLNGPEEEQYGYLNELSNGPNSLEYPDVPIDMWPRYVENYKRNPDGSLSPIGDGAGDPTGGLLSRIAEDTGILSSTAVLKRGLLGRTVIINTTPTLVVNSEYLRGYIFLNPNELAGATSAGTLLASATRSATGSSAALGVANFLLAHYYVVITAVGGGGLLTLNLETLDPASGTWIVAQTLVAGAGVGSTYAYVGELGTATDSRLSWSIPAGTVTFSAGFVLKNGLIGTSSGTSQTIYLGGPGVTIESGFPLLNGQKEKFFLEENLQLYAVAESTLPLKVFEL